MRIDAALRETHEAEAALSAKLLRVGDRHAAEQDVFHLSRTLSGWCDAHVERLAEEARRYDVSLEARSAQPGQRGEPREGLDPGLLLLRDLRELHLAAARASLAWTSLGQGAQAVSDLELLATVTACHPETIRTMKWTVQRVKETSPQVLAS